MSSHDYDSRQPLRTLLRLAAQPVWRYAAIVVLFSIKHAPQLLLPLAVGYVIDGLARSRYVFAEPWFVAAAALALLQNIPTHIAFTSLLSGVLRRLEFRLRALIVERLQQLSITFHHEAESGRLQTKVLRDVEVIFTMCHAVANTGLMAATTLVFALVTTAVGAPAVALFFLAAVPLAVWIERRVRRPLARRQHAFRTGVEAMSARVAQMVEMIPVARAHGVEEREIESVAGYFDTVYERGRRLDIYTGAFQATLWVSVMAVNLGATAFAGYLCWQGRITIGDVVMYTAFYQMLLGSVQMLLGLVPVVAQGIESMRSLDEVLLCADVERNEGKAPVDRVDGRLSFEDVSFTYPGAPAPAVANVSLAIEPGECVAFVGESGAGKSTLMGLVIGVLRPTCGRILLDGRDMETLDLRDYREFVAVVPQRVLLMAGSVRANVTFGLDGPVDERRVREALAAANALEFVDKLPRGLDTPIGDRGAKLSGGQAQRLAIARALIRDPRVIILDEATSALDAAGETLVQDAIERLARGRTTLIVAHRVPRWATRVVWMEAGRPVPSADHRGSGGPVHSPRLPVSYFIAPFSSVNTK